MDWDSCVRELGKALSRYNGLTNSAKLDLIAEATAEDLFKNRPFSYAYEIREYFEKEVAARSAEVHVHHGIAFGLLYRAVPGFSARHPNAQLQSKLETTSHIALTRLGRTCRAAVMQKKEGEKEGDDLYKLILTYALLNSDFDMYALLIKMAQDNNKRIPDEEKFTQQYRDILEKRLEWMKEHFQSPVQREQIQRHVQWIGLRIGHGKTGRKRDFYLDKIFHFDGQTPEHHFNQRKKWATQSLKHFKDKMLTDSGEDLADRLPDVDSEPFFWLGPSRACAESNVMSLAEIDISQCSPAWRILRPESPLDNNEYKKDMMEMVADFMIKDFEHIRVERFQQSSLDVVIPYVYLLERKFGGYVDEHAFFENLLRNHKDKFACSLQPNLSQCHYRLR